MINVLRLHVEKDYACACQHSTNTLRSDVAVSGQNGSGGLVDGLLGLMLKEQTKKAA